MTDAVFLFGAGASRPAEIPTATEMTERMLASTADNDLRSALQVIIGGLQMQLGREQLLNVGTIDIERVINAAALLADRNKLEFSPFVGTWHPIIDELERRGLSHLNAEEIVAASTPSLSFRSYQMRDSERAVVDSVRNFVVKTVSESLKRFGRFLTTRRDGELFQRLTSYLTGMLIEMTYLKPDRAPAVAYLDPILKEARAKRITIATLNYDNSIELRAAALNVSLTTGLKELQENSKFPELRSGIELLKLHGSANWAWTWPQQSGYRLRRTVVEITPKEMDGLTGRHVSITADVGDQLAVLFGGQNKLTSEGPFLDLLSLFKSWLFDVTSLVAIGYSFRDPHVNHLILRWLATDDARRLTVVEREGFDLQSSPFLTKYSLQEKLEFDNRGVTAFLKSYFPDHAVVPS